MLVSAGAAGAAGAAYDRILLTCQPTVWITPADPQVPVTTNCICVCHRQLHQRPPLVLPLSLSRFFFLFFSELCCLSSDFTFKTAVMLDVQQSVKSEHGRK